MDTTTSTTGLSALIKTGNRTIIPPMGIIYGREKVGKTTFCSCAPNPIILGAEDGANYVSTPFIKINSWLGMMESIRLIGVEKHEYKTVIVDSLDQFEPHVKDELCKMYGTKPVEEILGGFNKWTGMILPVWKTFLDQLTLLRERKGMMVIMIGHMHIKDSKDPRGDNYDTITLKLEPKTVGLLSSESDFIGFADFSTSVVKVANDKTERRGMTDGTRKLYFEWSPAYLAGNRIGLPAEIEMKKDNPYAGFGSALTAAIAAKRGSHG